MAVVQGFPPRSLRGFTWQGYARSLCGMKKLIGIAASVFAAALLFGTSCSKDKESLLVVALTANPPAPGLTSVVIAAGSTSKTFSLTKGLSGSATSLGLYLPASVTGSVTV